MWQRSLRFAFPDSCWKLKAGFETRMVMRRRRHHLGERNEPSLESGVHEGRAQQVNRSVRACRSAAPRLGRQVVPEEWANGL
jgi:hypothetical protein